MSQFFAIRWPKYWSFSFNISPSSEYSGLISLRMDWLDLLAVQGTLKSFLQHRWLGPPPSFDSVGLAWGPRICVCSKFPGSHFPSQSHQTVWCNTVSETTVAWVVVVEVLGACLHGSCVCKPQTELRGSDGDESGLSSCSELIRSLAPMVQRALTVFCMTAHHCCTWWKCCWTMTHRLLSMESGCSWHFLGGPVSTGSGKKTF